MQQLHECRWFWGRKCCCCESFGCSHTCVFMWDTLQHRTNAMLNTLEPNKKYFWLFEAFNQQHSRGLWGPETKGRWRAPHQTKLPPFHPKKHMVLTILPKLLLLWTNVISRCLGPPLSPCGPHAMTCFAYPVATPLHLTDVMFKPGIWLLSPNGIPPLFSYCLHVVFNLFWDISWEHLQMNGSSLSCLWKADTVSVLDLSQRASNSPKENRLFFTSFRVK